MAPIPCAWNVGNTDEAVVEVSVMSMPSVPRLSVTSTGAGRRKLLEVSIDAPRDGGMSDAWAVRVRGHLLSETGPVQEIAAVVPGSVLAMAVTGLPTPEVAARHPDVPGAEACGFTLLVDTLGLPQRFEFRLRAALPDGSRVKVAAIGGERRAADDSVRATLAATAGHLSGEDGHHAPDADARRTSGCGRLRSSAV